MVPVDAGPEERHEVDTVARGEAAELGKLKALLERPS